MPARATPSVVRAKIEIVWPHDGASVRDASLANITAYLITGSGVGSSTALDAPPCDWEPTVRLWAALNNESARYIALGRKRLLAAGGRRYPVWDFNDIDVSAARDPSNKLTFFVTVDGVRTLHSVWAHASDARTLFPQPDVPTGVAFRFPQTVDARIEIVWPHGGLAVTDASLANITAYLFAAGTLTSISPSIVRLPSVRLHWALNNEPEREGSSLLGRPRVITAGTGVEFVAWDFNDVDISAGRDPLNRLYFWVSVEGADTRSNIWAHGVDARTIFPQPDVLNSCR